MRAIEDARALHGRGAEAHAIAELVTYAHDLLDIIGDEIASNPIAVPGAAGAVLTQLRGRLQTLERHVTPARH